MEPRIYPSVRIEGSMGAPVAGKRNRLTAPHKTSPAEPDRSSVPQVSKQIRLGVESIRKMKEEIQEKRLEMQRTHQVEMERMLEAHRKEMKEMRGAPQPKEERTPDAHLPQAEIQRHLGEVWKPGDDGPILARVGGANLPADGGGTASNN